MSRQPADAARSLPTVLDLGTAARMLGIGRTVAYQLVRQGNWPTPVLRLGNQIKVPSAPLLELLGLSTDPAPDLSVGRTARHAGPDTSG
jgi:hypothetical protein